MSSEEMVGLLTNMLNTVYMSSNIANSIPSVDGTEYVFLKNPYKIQEACKLYEIVRQINYDLAKDKNYKFHE